MKKLICYLIGANLFFALAVNAQTTPKQTQSESTTNDTSTIHRQPGKGAKAIKRREVKDSIRTKELIKKDSAAVKPKSN